MFQAFVKSKYPVILYEDGRTHEETVEFLIERGRTSTSRETVINDARRLTTWLNFLHENGKRFFEASDLDVNNFKDELLEEQDAYVPDTVNRHLKVVCDAYWFCESKGKVRRMIGIPEEKKRYRIEVGAGNKPGKYRNKFLIRHGSQAQLEVPTLDQMLNLHKQILMADYSAYSELGESMRERDRLMFRWLANTGLRRRELIMLQCSDIPVDPKSPMVSVRIVKGTKNSKSRTVKVPKELILNTLKYIENEREHILEEKRGKFGDPELIKELFVNGGNNSVRPQMSAATVYQWIKSLDPNLTPHGIRRFALTRYAATVCRNLFRLKSESPDARLVIEKDALTAVMLQAGHNSLDTTIKFYINTGMVLAATTSEDSKGSLLKIIQEKRDELALLESSYEQADLASQLI